MGTEAVFVHYRQTGAPMPVPAHEHQPYPHSDRPRWLDQVLSALSGRATREGLDPVYRQLRRLAGAVPFTVVHDWHARTVWPTVSTMDTGSVTELHRRALAGDTAGEDEWLTALEPLLQRVYRSGYAYADGYATARSAALVYAHGNGFGEDEAVSYADYYARLSTDANARMSAEAHAIAQARALARAFATADEEAYAGAYPYAVVRIAAATNEAATNEAATNGTATDAAYDRLAIGLAGSLGRA
jgi:hypothetical protein